MANMSSVRYLAVNLSKDDIRCETLKENEQI